MPALRRSYGNDDGRRGEALVVTGGELAATLCPRVEMGELRAEDRRLERVEAAVPPTAHRVVLGLLSVVPQEPGALGGRWVGRRHGAAVAEGAEVLRRVEAEGGRVGDRAGTRSAVLGADRLGSILDHLEIVRAGKREDPIEIRALAVEVDGEDRPRPLGQQRLEILGIERVGRLVDVREHGPRAGRLDARDRGDAGVRGRDHLVPLTDTDGLQRDRDRVGPGRDADSMSRPAVVGERALERLDRIAEDELAPVEHATRSHRRARRGSRRRADSGREREPTASRLRPSQVRLALLPVEVERARDALGELDLRRPAQLCTDAAVVAVVVADVDRLALGRERDRPGTRRSRSPSRPARQGP